MRKKQTLSIEEEIPDVEEELSSVEKQIIKDVLKSGFPLELEIANILEDGDWIVMPNEYIVDKNTSKNIEIDMLGIKGTKLTLHGCKRRFSSLFKLIIECKKSEKAKWVFFTREPTTFYNDELIKHAHNFGINKPFVIKEAHYSDTDYFHNKIKYSVLNLMKWKKISTNYCIALEHKDKPSPIYKATTNLTKALSILKGREQLELRTGRWEYAALNTYVPIIVLDGDLFEGWIEKGKLKIKKTRRIPLVINTGDDILGRVLITVVIKAEFNKLLQNINDDMKMLHSEFAKLPIDINRLRQ